MGRKGMFVWVPGNPVGWWSLLLGGWIFDLARVGCLGMWDCFGSGVANLFLLCVRSLGLGLGIGLGCFG